MSRLTKEQMEYIREQVTVFENRYDNIVITWAGGKSEKLRVKASRRIGGTMGSFVIHHLTRAVNIGVRGWNFHHKQETPLREYRAEDGFRVRTTTKAVTLEWTAEPQGD